LKFSCRSNPPMINEAWCYSVFSFFHQKIFGSFDWGAQYDFKKHKAMNLIKRQWMMSQGVQIELLMFQILALIIEFPKKSKKSFDQKIWMNKRIFRLQDFWILMTLNDSFTKIMVFQLCLSSSNFFSSSNSYHNQIWFFLFWIFPNFQQTDPNVQQNFDFFIHQARFIHSSFHQAAKNFVCVLKFKKTFLYDLKLILFNWPYELIFILNF
jgi:hypothetical protein